MKSFAFGLLMLVACAAALPQAQDLTDFGAERRDIAEIVVNAFDRFIQRILNRGLDPYVLDRADGEYVFFLPTVFSASARIENLRFTGLSNIVINSISYSPISNNLNIDIAMPGLMASVGGASFEVTALGREISGSLSGLLAINGIGVRGSAKVTVGDGVSVTDVDVDASLDSIQSALAVRILGLDLSIPIQNWLNNLPANLSLYDELIDRGLARILEILLNHYLNKP
ncbi:PREDICTED: uncharacterized protein LOC106114763 [Papilio xuthus]|uniref:Uncharacterized protein LOC106114763 n=1 Tax=Papilio xuthus TaxID=66420 RepID=A0AAJ6Z244_PAPXU|nr:PREDICTED: uncharacterized protein LOC106114763 [Papilio xuthus]